MDKRVRSLVDRTLLGHTIQADEIAYLLEFPALSEEAYHMQWASRHISQTLGEAEIHGQVGVNIAPCPCNCQFCSFAAGNGIFKHIQVQPLDEILLQCQQLAKQGVNAIYLMATANFDFRAYIDIGRQVRIQLGDVISLVANIGDFNLEQAVLLKEAGFDGVYHALRLGEGQATRIQPKKRLDTMRCTVQAGLKLGTCLEPVGPEHDTGELVEKILAARDAKPVFSGAARRINFEGSALESYGMVSEVRMAQLVSVVRLATGHEVPGNCTHEPCASGVIAGASLLWAEAGSNPRDTSDRTENSRGFDPLNCRNLFQEGLFPVLKGPSRYFGTGI